MPHLIVEYSANLEAALDLPGLIRVLHDKAVTIEALPTGGVRTRASRRELFSIADGHPNNGFINVTLRIAKGRPPDVRQEVGEALFSTLIDYVQTVYDQQPLSLSFEIQEISPETRWKHSNIRDYMEKRRNE